MQDCFLSNKLRQDLLGQLFRISNKDTLNLDPKELCHLTLYLRSSLPIRDNRMIIDTAIQYLLRIPNVLNGRGCLRSGCWIVLPT